MTPEDIEAEAMRRMTDTPALDPSRLHSVPLPSSAYAGALAEQDLLRILYDEAKLEGPLHRAVIGRVIARALRRLATPSGNAA